MKIRTAAKRGMVPTAGGLDRALKGKQYNWQHVFTNKNFRLIRKYLFSKDPGLRHAIAEDFIKHKRHRELGRIVLKLSAKQFPPKFFERKAAYAQEGPRRIKIDSEYFKSEIDKGPSFLFRGFEVYESTDERLLGHEGMFVEGKIFVNGALSPKIKRVIAAHEVGEILSHDAGIILELFEVKNRGWSKEFLSWTRKEAYGGDGGRAREALQIAEMFPELRGFVPDLKEISEIERLDPHGP